MPISGTTLRTQLSLEQTSEYYPFGGLFTASNLATNKYLYNGKELQNEFFENYDYGARFYDAELGRFPSIDPMTEKYASITPYAYALNNPIIFIDPDGREIDISELMKSKDHANAFVIFAGTEEGKAFLNNYASAGQKFEYNGKVFYEAKEAGKFDKAGVDLNFTISSEKETSGTNSKINGVNDFDVNIKIAKEGFGSDSKILNLVKSISHETFMHADNAAKDAMDGKKDYSSVPIEYRQYEDHADHYYVSREYFANPNNPNVNSFAINCLSVLKQTSNQLGLNYSDSKIKSIIWNFKGSLITADPVTGKLSYK